MKQKLILLISIFHLLTASAQDTTKVLFIGNSFTSYNDLHILVKCFLTSANIPVITGAYAPGGISVGDTIDGNMAHMNNPIVFNLIRNTDWDYLVLQDKQGRFVLDSGVFTAASHVIEGHLRIRDSLHYYHPCAKMIWFAGWGLKNGDPPQLPTGIDMIDHIAVNYRVLNDTAKDVIAPIGLAWKKTIKDNPNIELWLPDFEHPTLSGSFLTAAIIYGVITQVSPTTNPYTSNLSIPEADILKANAEAVLDSTSIHKLSNISGIIPIEIAFTGLKVKGPAGKVLYQWYLDNNYLSTTSDSSIIPAVSGIYRLWTKDGSGYWQKSCDLEVVMTSIPEVQDEITQELLLFPNPANDYINIQIPAITFPAQISIMSTAGTEQEFNAVWSTNEKVDLHMLKRGIYCIRVINPVTGKHLTGKFIKM